MGLPLDIWNQFGATYSEFNDTSIRRKQIKKHLVKMFDELKNHLNIDAAVDKLATKYQHDALPPVFFIFFSLFDQKCETVKRNLLVCY